MASELKRTPFHELHRKQNARMGAFAGWEMPIHYTGILEEHRAVRERVGMFDISHMGEIEIGGSGALDFLQTLIPNDASRLNVDQALYTPLCHEDGGTIDDLIAYRLPDKFLLVVNASNTEGDLRWIEGHARAFEDVHVRDASGSYALIAVQGPDAKTALRRHVGVNLARVRPFDAVETELEREPVLISRTGYTGEDGFEIYGPPDPLVALWKVLIKADVPPIGLGARDSLRLEAGLPLYGHELDEEITPIEAGLSWTVKDKPHAYIGKEVLLLQKREGVKRRLIGLEMRDPGVPRAGYPIEFGGERCGFVTSGVKSPTLGTFIAMGYLRTDLGPDDPLPVGREIEVGIHGRKRRAEIVELPFYRRPQG